MTMTSMLILQRIQIAKLNVFSTMGSACPERGASQAQALPVDFKNAPERLDFAVETLEKEFVGFCAIDQIHEQSGNFSTVTFILEPYRKQGHCGIGKALDAQVYV